MPQFYKRQNKLRVVPYGKLPPLDPNGSPCNNTTSYYDTVWLLWMLRKKFPIPIAWKILWGMGPGRWSFTTVYRFIKYDWCACRDGQYFCDKCFTELKMKALCGA